MSSEPVSDLLPAATQFFGGRICLDFANTVDWRTSENPVELIPAFSSFLEWSVRRGILTVAATAALQGLAASSQTEAAAVLTEAHALRRSLWACADALSRHSLVTLSPFNHWLETLPPQPGLVPHNGAYLHDLRGDDLREPLWPVLWSVSALLTSSDAGRIGCCHAEGCGWYYVDESPNRKRLWCSSELCGNRERGRRAYAKRRSTGRG